MNRMNTYANIIFRNILIFGSFIHVWIIATSVPPCFPGLPSFHTHPTWCSSQTPINTNLCYPDILGYVTFPWSVGDLPVTTLIGKTDSPSPSN